MANRDKHSPKTIVTKEPKKATPTTKAVLHSHLAPSGFTLPGPGDFGPVELPHKPIPISAREMESAAHATAGNEDTRDEYVTVARKKTVGE